MSKIDKSKVYFVPYISGSEGAKLLADKMGIRSVKTDGTSKILANPKDRLLIFWGKPNEHVQNQLRNFNYNYINHPSYIRSSVDKLRFYELIRNKDYAIPYTLDPTVAYSWLVDEGVKVIARTTVTGMGGEGIDVLRTEEDWDTTKKYKVFTKYIPKRHEYRVHVVDGAVITISKKVMPNGNKPEGNNWEVRSHDNGFIFQRVEEQDVPKQVLSAAIDCVARVGLTFAGVDVIYNEKKKQAFVCEVNSAPGIEGGTVDAYAKALEEYIDRLADCRLEDGEWQ